MTKVSFIVVLFIVPLIGCKKSIVEAEPQKNEMNEIYTILLEQYTGYIDSVESVTSYKYPEEYKRFIVALSDIDSLYTYHSWMNLQDMPLDFINSYKPNNYTIYNFSEAYYDSIKSGYYILSNNLRAHIQIISKPIYKTDSEILIECGSYWGPLGADWGLYKLNKTNGVWKITFYKPLWIS